MKVLLSQTEQALVQAIQALKTAGLPAPDLPPHLLRDYAAEVNELLEQFADLELTVSQADQLISELQKILSRYQPKPTGNEAGDGNVAGNDERRVTLIKLLQSGTKLYIKNVPLGYDPSTDSFVAGAHRGKSVSAVARSLTGHATNGWLLITDQNGKKVF